MKLPTVKRRTPSMDDKETPSPPRRTVEQYDADKDAGINPVGVAYDRQLWDSHVKRCKALDLDPELTSDAELRCKETAK